MNRKSQLAAISLAPLLALLLLGFWVGAFETFGGYVQRQQMFFDISLISGVLLAAILYLRWKFRFALAVAFFAITQLVYVVGTALGQTYYIQPDSWADFLSTFLLALNNQL